MLACRHQGFNFFVCDLEIEVEDMLTNLICVGAGSCLGGMFRYLVGKWVGECTGDGFPWPTLAVNLAGCLLLGVLYAMLERGMQMTPALRLFLTVGFCGGFTTFSTFANESVTLLMSGQQILAGVAYVIVSLIGGFACLILGGWHGRLPMI